MSVALRQNQSSRGTISRPLLWAGLGLCFALLVGYVAYDVLVRAHGIVAGAAEATKAKSGSEPAANRPTVSLTESKINEAKIATEPVRFERIATGVAVVGIIQANADRQVAIPPRAAGIVREVHVVLEQKVKRGDPLVTLDCPDLGTARLNLRRDSVSFRPRGSKRPGDRRSPQMSHF